MTLLFVEQAAFTTAVEASRKIAAAAVARPKDGEDFIFSLLNVSWTNVMSGRGESMNRDGDGA